ncbi:MAG: AraC family transcriptional regulator ligand-binding domain-containing protein [Gammaproteobacteria bacterium]|nr:AraC family transcriptional regulator ligand-binding domain-containing protein [Gammaproteobacteria bacterium]
MDLALSREVDSHALLRGTRLFLEDVLKAPLDLSPEQFLRLIANAQDCLDAPDTAFLLGQQLLPGHYGPASQALEHAANLGQALDILVGERQVLSPLLVPRLKLDGEHAYLYWLDPWGSGEARRFLVEMSQCAVQSMSRWLSGERLPWRFLFSHERPEHLEQYQAHLGMALHFGCRIDVMVLPREHLLRPWPRASATVCQAALAEGRRERTLAGREHGLLDRVEELCAARLRAMPDLDSLAAELALSPATLKRKLKKHGSSYQALQDGARLHAALYLVWARGYDNEAVAERLAFHDAPNFRRAFRRWTGLVPSVLRGWLEA